MSVAERKTPVSPESPWLGLNPFTEDVSEYFFGRDIEVRDLFQRVVHKPLTVLFGRSGLGKTSLLQAALMPRLRDAGFLPIVLRLDYAEGAAPLLQQFVDALISVLKPVLPGLDASLTHIPADPKLPWLLFHDPVFGLVSQEAPRPVVLLDQFEEVFTLGQANSERQKATAEFLEMLADLVENRVPDTLRAKLGTDDDLADRLDYAARPVKVLLSLREDFLHQLERYRSHMPALMDNRFELRLLTGPQALEAVIEPGRLRCRPNTALTPIVSEATGGAIVRFVAGVASDIPLPEIDAVPPLLSLLCAELNEQRMADRESVIRPEQLKGRAEDILEHFYERCFSSHPAAVRRFVEDRLLSAAGFRESTTVDTAIHELVQAGLARAGAVEAINRLVDSRLLTSDDRGGVRRIELTHDILTAVARRSRDLRHEAEAIAQRRRQRNRLVGFIFGLALLVAGTSIPLAIWALRERKGAIKQEKIAVAAKDNALQRSRDAELARAEAERQKQDALVAKDDAEGQKQNAVGANKRLEEKLEEAARSDRLVAQEKLAAGEAPVALAHLARAITYRPGSTLAPEIAFAAFNDWRFPLPTATLLGHEGPINSAQFSPDGKRFVTASKDNTARLWETDSGKLLAILRDHEGSVRSAQFSPDGKRIVTASDDNTARLWETDSGKLLATLRGHESPVNSAQFSPDGKRIVTASTDNTARLWETDSGKLLATLQGHEDEVLSAQFSPDGKRIVTASLDKTARLWDTESGKLLATLQGHEDNVLSAQFSPDGKRIVTTSNDKTARLWETDSGKLLAILRDHEDSVNSAQFSPDRKRIVTASDDKTAQLWIVLPSTAGASPEWFRDFLQYLAQQRLNQDGELEWISSTELTTIRDRLLVVARASSTQVETPYLSVLRYFVHE
jgi:hypothetical protein